MRKLQAAAVFLLTVVYFSYVFQLSGPDVWRSGIGDWGDPNFINYVLEHWYRSATRFSNPASPPMYFPARGTLGYSHALILYAPLYGLLRFGLAPLQAHTASIFLVLVVGTFCLYLLLRNVFALRFSEALALTTFFATSRNVVNAMTSIWSQTASVFLIPPIALLAAAGFRRPTPGPLQTAMGAAAGCLAALLFAQDFYTAQFALFFVALGGAAWLCVGTDPSLRHRIARFWEHEPRTGIRMAAVVAVIALAWMTAIFMSGGGVFHLGPVRFASRDWRRPALVALAAIAMLVYARGGPPLAQTWRANGWLRAFLAGALTGAVIFLWIYLPTYLQHPGFWEEDLMASLSPHDPTRWSAWDFIWALGTYESVRVFRFAFVAGALACLPWITRDTTVRAYAVPFLFVSLLVLVAPVRFEYFSVWRVFVAPLPGFTAIRDPRRIIYVYELAVVLVAAALVRRLPHALVFRIAMTIAVAGLVLLDWNKEVFAFNRRAEEYRRWVDSPVEVDGSCRSFFVRPATRAYTSRWDDPGILYNVDAMFVALNHGLPTLNGYSAWFPDGWRLFDPSHPGYPEAVRSWVRQRGLTDVCAFDIEERTMRPYVP